jgi:hypothetical protein
MYTVSSLYDQLSLCLVNGAQPQGRACSATMLLVLNVVVAVVIIVTLVFVVRILVFHLVSIIIVEGLPFSKRYTVYTVLYICYALSTKWQEKLIIFNNFNFFVLEMKFYFF